MLSRPSLLLTLILGLSGAAAAEKRPDETVGTLDFFGLRKLTETEVRAALPIKEGDRYERSAVKSIVAELEKIPGVQKATMSGITVDGTGKLKVFVGVQEVGAKGFTFRDAPQGAPRLPDELAQIYRDFIAALGPSVRQGGDREDHSQGHALNLNPELRRAQEAAIAQMKTHAAVVREVLHSSSHAADRGAAAWLLGYAPDKKEIVADLVAAARDPDSTVRNNATRALGTITTFAAARPALGIAIPPDVFLEMLGSVTWTDRNKVSFLLDGMTKSGARELLQTLRTHALPELVEIARWKSEGHAFPAIRILGRIAGWEDQETLRVWREGGVEKIIAAASAK